MNVVRCDMDRKAVACGEIQHADVCVYHEVNEAKLIAQRHRMSRGLGKDHQDFIPKLCATGALLGDAYHFCVHSGLTVELSGARAGV